MGALADQNLCVFIIIISPKQRGLKSKLYQELLLLLLNQCANGVYVSNNPTNEHVAIYWVSIKSGYIMLMGTNIDMKKIIFNISSLMNETHLLFGAEMSSYLVIYYVVALLAWHISLLLHHHELIHVCLSNGLVMSKMVPPSYICISFLFMMSTLSPSCSGMVFVYAGNFIWTVGYFRIIFIGKGTSFVVKHIMGKSPRRPK
jgi:hypothetical protein